MKLLKREVELSIRIKLKTISCWLIHKRWLREKLESGNNWSSAIFIMVLNRSKASYLYTKDLRFEGGLKIVEKFWEFGPGFVCPISFEIGHNCLENRGLRLP